MNREAIAVALYNLVKVAPGVITTSRRLKNWSDVPSEEQPAVFLAQGKETVDASAQKMGAPNVHRLEFSVYVYTNSKDDPSSAPTTKLNAILDAIEAALATTPGTKQTLNGLVQHAFISGSIETDEGVLGDQAIAIVPIEVLAV